MEEYIESELSGNIQVKLVGKNIVLVSPGTNFMHMRVMNFRYKLNEFQKVPLVFPISFLVLCVFIFG